MTVTMASPATPIRELAPLSPLGLMSADQGERLWTSTKFGLQKLDVSIAAALGWREGEEMRADSTTGEEALVNRLAAEKDMLFTANQQAAFELAYLIAPAMSGALKAEKMVSAPASD
ncbi:hypothetical protein [Sinorhizobium americanum]|nr:hypothetical protein [Sinorhizobium americanum]